MINAWLPNERHVVGCDVALVEGRQVIHPYALAALIATPVIFSAGWQTNQWKNDAEQKQAIEQAALDQQELQRLERARSSAALSAQVVARKSEARLRADAAASQSAFVSLRDTSASALRAAAGSLSACTAISATYDELLLDSARAYRELATQADGHVIDLRVQISTP